MLVAALTAAALAQVDVATPPPSVDRAIDTAIVACEKWLLEPRTWTGDIDRFPEASGLAARGLTPQPNVPDVALPPPAARRALHHWRVPIGEGGVYLSVSDQLPLCHLSGGGPDDLQPGIEKAVSSGQFLARWTHRTEEPRNGLRSTRYISKEDAKLTMTITRAAASKAARDRVQFLATVQYDTGT